MGFSENAVHENYINKSEWLPLAEIKRYADAAIKAGRAVFNNGAILPSEKAKMPIDRLYSDGIIEQEHHSGGMKFYRLCLIARGEYVASENPGEAVEQKNSAEIKTSAVYNTLTQRQRAQVDRVLFERVSENDYGWMRQCRASLQDSFEALYNLLKTENLEKAIDMLRKKNKIQSA